MQKIGVMSFSLRLFASKVLLLTTFSVEMMHSNPDKKKHYLSLTELANEVRHCSDSWWGTAIHPKATLRGSLQTIDKDFISSFRDDVTVDN